VVVLLTVTGTPSPAWLAVRIGDRSRSGSRRLVGFGNQI